MRIVLNKTQMKDKELVEAYKSAGHEVVENAFVAPGEIKYKKKLRKYASYQNHLNRKRKV